MSRAVLAACLFMICSAPPAQPAAPELSAEAAALLVQRDELTTAIVKRDARRVAAWIRAHKELNFNFDEIWRGRTYESPLTLAINRDFVDIARLLLNAGAQVDRSDGDGRSAIHCARSADAVRLLAQHGANLNALDRSGRTAVATAVERGNLEAVDMLVASGARLDVPLKGTGLLTRAVESRRPEMIGPLLERGLNPRAPPTRALWLLIESGDAGPALLLIRRGADVNLANDRGETLLTRALFRQRWDIAEALLEAGASLRVPDTPGCRLGSVVCQSLQPARLATLNPPLLRKMAAKGLDLNAVAADGHSALTSLIMEHPLAVRAVRPAGAAVGVARNAASGEVRTTLAPPTTTTREIAAPDAVARVRALLDARADPNLKYQGATPLMLAIALPGKPPELADALLDAGGRIEAEATIVRAGPSDVPSLAGAAAGDIASRTLLSADISLIGMSVGPLTWAAGRGRPDIALRLIARHRRVTRADRHLLYFAAAGGQWDLLLGALPFTLEVDASNRANVTPLMLAADAGRADAGAGAAVGGRERQCAQRSKLAAAVGYQPGRRAGRALADASQAVRRLHGVTRGPRERAWGSGQDTDGGGRQGVAWFDVSAILRFSPDESGCR